MDRVKKPASPNGPPRGRNTARGGAAAWYLSVPSAQMKDLIERARSQSQERRPKYSFASAAPRHYLMPLGDMHGSQGKPTPHLFSNSGNVDGSCWPSPPAEQGVNLQISKSGSAPRNLRLCIDFGTSASKVIVIDDTDPELEKIDVLDLEPASRYGQGRTYLLTASVYIDNDGRLWFGDAAARQMRAESANSSRKRLDNIKWRLCRREWNEEIHRDYNPTPLSLSYGDMVLAYLMFLTWTINTSLARRGYPLNIPRRFATPCLPRKTSKGIIQRLRTSLSLAQVLADRFDEQITQGLPVGDFLPIARRLTDRPIPYPYVIENTTEPLGVIGSLLDWSQSIDNLTMVVDVGASSVDFSLYRVHVGRDSRQDLAIEIPGGAYTLRLGGNNLDWILLDYILSKAALKADDSLEHHLRTALDVQIRELKERLFTHGDMECRLENGILLKVTLLEFLALPRVEEFGKTITETFHQILNSINSSWIRWILHRPDRRLFLVQTGGGSSMPMITALGERPLTVHGQDVPLEPVHGFPAWLRSHHQELEAVYPRLAVCLGGARRRRFREGSPHLRKPSDESSRI